MRDTNGLKETTRVTAPVASNMLSVNVFTVAAAMNTKEPESALCIGIGVVNEQRKNRAEEL